MREIIQRICDKFHIKLEHKYVTFSICVAISAVLWFLNAFNKEYSSEISFKVRYENLPRDKYLATDLPENIMMDVSAKGFSLLSLRMSNANNIITIDLNKLDYGSEDKFTLLLNDIKDKILMNLTSDIRINSFRPAKIDFEFLPAVQRKIKISPRVDYSIDKYFMLKNEIQCIPDSILVSSSSQVLDTLKCVFTEVWKAGKISHDVSKQVEICPMKGIEIKGEGTVVSLNIERFTEAKQSIPIKVKNGPKHGNVRVVLFPNEVEVNYNVGLSHFGHIGNEDFEFWIDYAEVEKSNSKLDVKLTKSPSYINNLKYTPHKVEFVIESGD